MYLCKWEAAGRVEFQWTEIQDLRKVVNIVGHHADIEIDLRDGSRYRFSANGFARYRLFRDLRAYLEGT